MSSSFTTDLSLVNLFYFNNHNNHPVDLLIGEIIIWPTNSNYPNGFLLCDGSPYSTTEYSELYAIIGTTYGSGSGTFKVPDFKDRHIRAGNMQGTIQFGNTGGNNTINTDNLPAHTHNISANCNYSKTNLNYNTSYTIASVRNYQSYSWIYGTNDANNSKSAGGGGSSPVRQHQHQVQYTEGFTGNTPVSVGTNLTTAHINNYTLNVPYSMGNTFNGQKDYVPKSKKVYYLIYSGKH